MRLACRSAREDAADYPQARALGGAGDGIKLSASHRESCKFKPLQQYNDAAKVSLDELLCWSNVLKPLRS